MREYFLQDPKMVSHPFRVGRLMDSRGQRSTNVQCAKESSSRKKNVIHAFTESNMIKQEDDILAADLWHKNWEALYIFPIIIMPEEDFLILIGHKRSILINTDLILTWFWTPSRKVWSKETDKLLSSIRMPRKVAVIIHCGGHWKRSWNNKINEEGYPSNSG